jgi:hypothetical protein
MMPQQPQDPNQPPQGQKLPINPQWQRQFDIAQLRLETLFKKLQQEWEPPNPPAKPTQPPAPEAPQSPPSAEGNTPY